MERKIKIEFPIIVEGKYDKIKLASIVDGTIIVVNGFSIFTDFPLRDMIIDLSKRTKLILLLDSDAAGFKIRGFFHSILDKKAYIDIYIPDIAGVEKRKTKASREGKLGVEGIRAELLRTLFTDFYTDTPKTAIPITQLDFMRLGLSGGENSSMIRGSLYANLGLPEHISTKNAVNIINKMVTKTELYELVEKIKKGGL